MKTRKAKPMKGYVKYPEPKYTERVSASEHTPTPWIVGKREESDNTIDIVAESGTQSYNKKQLVASVSPVGEWSKGYQEANAEFIVRAVNSHDELVQELKAAAHYIKEFGGEVALNFNFLSANEVIKKAQGK